MSFLPEYFDECPASEQPLLAQSYLQRGEDKDKESSGIELTRNEKDINDGHPVLVFSRKIMET